jgi:hypothetical protein
MDLPNTRLWRDDPRPMASPPINAVGHQATLADKIAERIDCGRLHFSSEGVIRRDRH